MVNLIKEIEPHVAAELCRLFPLDNKVDWNPVLRRSKEAASKVSSMRVVAPVGMSGPPMISSRGRGFRDRRDTRGRFGPTMFRNARPFDYGRYNSELFYQMMTSVSAKDKDKLCGHALPLLFLPSSSLACVTQPKLPQSPSQSSLSDKMISLVTALLKYTDLVIGRTFFHACSSERLILILSVTV